MTSCIIDYLNLNPWNSKENHFRFHPSFVRKFPLKLLNYAVSSSQSSDFRARSLLNFFTRWVKKFCSPLNVKLEFSECDKLLSGGCKWDLRTKQCKMSMWFYDEFHGFRKKSAGKSWAVWLLSSLEYWCSLLEKNINKLEERLHYERDYFSRRFRYEIISSN